MIDIESLNAKLKLSDINAALGMEISRKIEVEPEIVEEQSSDESLAANNTTVDAKASNLPIGTVSSRISRYIGSPTPNSNSSSISAPSSTSLENKSSYSVDNKPTSRIRILVLLNMYRDLTLQTPMEYEMIVPGDYITAGNLRIRLLDRNAMRLLNGNTEINYSSTSEGDFLKIPWMEGTKYPLSVWFFAVRDLFKKPLPVGQLWTTSYALNDEFCIPYVLNKSKNRSSSAINAAAEDEEVRLLCGVGKTRGKRNYMEDVDFAIEDIRIKDKIAAAAYGVLDGHGGKQCADFALEDLPSQIASCLRGGSTYPDSLYTAFLKTDKEFLESNNGASNAGCTSNVLLYEKEKNILYCANTGDTRAVLCRHTSSINTPIAYDLTVDRKATDPEEVARITKAGGFVVNGRVLGSLAISRALGDCQLKEGNNRIVIPDPELSAFSPAKRDQFIIVATDGLWDVMSSQSAVDYVNNLLQDEDLLENSFGRSKEEIVLRLNQICLNVAVHAVNNLRSADNVTVMIIIIQGGKDDPAENPAADNPKLGLSDTFSWLIGSYIDVQDPIEEDIAEIRISSRSRPPAKDDKSPSPLVSSKKNLPAAESNQNLNSLTSSSITKTRAIDMNSKNTNSIRNTSNDDDDDDDLMSFLKDDSNF